MNKFAELSVRCACGDALARDTVIQNIQSLIFVGGNIGSRDVIKMDLVNVLVAMVLHSTHKQTQSPPI